MTVSTLPARTPRAGAGLGPGIVLGLAAAASFGTSGSLGASLMTGGWSPGGLVAVRVTLAALFLTVPGLLQMRGHWGDLRRHAWAVVGFGAMGVAGAQVFYFQAIQRLSVGVALLLEYLAIVLVVVWVWLRHGHRPRGLTVWGCVACIVGLVVVLDVFGDVRVSALGVLWGLAAAVCLGAYYVIIARDEEPLPPAAFAWIGSATGAVIMWLVVAAGIAPWRGSMADVTLGGAGVPWWVPVIGLSLVAGAFAYVASIGAARRLGARLASFVGLTEVLFAVALAWLLLGQELSVLQIAGGVVVVAGVVLVRLGESAGVSRNP